ncbi:MAG: cytidine deaminase [Bacteroidales bacterium]|nr:cytidine deaminase [Bacteroidales bacterium]
MAKKAIRLEYEEFLSLNDLPKDILELIEMARKAASRAYSPYSEFQVGASLELIDGQKFCANNQENKAYPSGMCAERSLLFYINGNYPDTAVKRMVIVACQNGELIDDPVYPCGACRQVMSETEERFESNMEVWMAGAKKIRKVNSIDTLLPLKFSFSH